VGRMAGLLAPRATRGGGAEFQRTCTGLGLGGDRQERCGDAPRFLPGSAVDGWANSADHLLEDACLTPFRRHGQIARCRFRARRRVEVLHLHGYAISQLVRHSRSPTIADPEEIEQCLHAARGGLDPRFTDGFLFAEWEAVVDYWGIKSWEAYRDAVRVGRGSPLSPRQRRQLWDVFARVQEDLDRTGRASWGEVCDRLGHVIEEEGVRPFRHVIVDEAQDLGPRELRLIASLAAPGPRALFFTGDIGQRIYRWPFPWLAAGVDVRGRAQRLRVNYRTSAEIHRFSDTLLPAKLAEVDGAEETRQTISVLRGPEPEVVGGESVEDEITALAIWLRDLRARGIEPGQIAIFGRTRQVARECAEPALAQAGLTGRWLAPDSDLATDAVVIGTMHAAKGLEFRAVALVGCDSEHLPLRDALARADGDEARQLEEEQERHLLYVACTRARESLLITYSGKATSYLARGRSPTRPIPFPARGD
jgi:UvrD-like helicase C-terminal domain/UvrD/REP helicase N-terminal domain